MQTSSFTRRKFMILTSAATTAAALHADTATTNTIASQFLAFFTPNRDHLGVPLSRLLGSSKRAA